MNAPLNMTSSTDLPSKLSKLIRRLSSEHDGEVAATGRAIERTLKGAGHDLHTLADFVEQYGGIVFRTTPIFVPSVRTWTPSPKPEPKPKMKPAPKWNKIGADSRRAWLQMLAKEDKKLTYGGLPHSAYVGKFKAYLERIDHANPAFNDDEIVLINRWIAAFWQKWEGHRP